MNKKFIAGASVLAVLVIGAVFFLYGLAPASADANAPTVVFTVTPGEGFRNIIGGLANAGLIRSPFAAETFSVITGSAFSLQPGLYRLNPAMSAPAVLREIAGGATREVTVTIPEGADIYQVDAILSEALVVRRGDLINFHDDGNLEGRLFPDTYRFFAGSDVKDVVQKFLDNFNAKAGPLLATDAANATSDLIMASMVQKEVPDAADQGVVAGILWKRERAGMPLQVDVTVCYAMRAAALGAAATDTALAAVPATPAAPAAATPPDCNALDLKLDSPYNTYLYRGLPPGPIGNPGLAALEAAIHPTHSPYWYYLSDPKTGKTIFATTLDEQHRNTVKYLESN